MGSSGSGNFSDYSQSQGNGNQGGSTNKDICGRALHTRLEEVDRCAYYIHHHALPDVGEIVTIEMRSRIAVLSSTGELIGYLPTEFNYIAQCIAAGFTYGGRVSGTRTVPLLNVTVDIAPL